MNLNKPYKNSGWPITDEQMKEFVQLTLKQKLNQLEETIAFLEGFMPEKKRRLQRELRRNNH